MDVAPGMEDSAEFLEDDELEFPEEHGSGDGEPALEHEAELLADRAARLPHYSSLNEVPPLKVSASPSGPGVPLAPTVREEMEQTFGHDLSRVRVHAGAVAERQARALDADAYTLGCDIVFGEGSFAPDTTQGRRLLAHEIVHVLQQSRAGGIVTKSTSPHVQKSPRAEPATEVDRPQPAALGNPVSKTDPTRLEVPSPPVLEPSSERSGPSTSPLRAEQANPTTQPELVSDDTTPMLAGHADPGAVPGTPTDIGVPLVQSDTILPRLAHLFPARVPQQKKQEMAELANESPATASSASEYVLPATVDDLSMLVDALRQASKGARTQLSSQSAGACAALDRASKKARERVDAEKDRADAFAKATIDKRSGDLERTLAATRSSIDWQEGIRQQEAETHGRDAKLEMAMTVSRQRGRMERAVERWVGYIDTLRDHHVKRIQDTTAERVPLPMEYAALYDRTFLSSRHLSLERAQVMRDATVVFAKAVTEEFRKMEPEAIKLTRETAGDMAGKVHEYAGQTYAEFDKVLPALLKGIDDQVGAAKEDIANKARDARGRLQTAATPMRARLVDVKQNWCDRNAATAARVTQRITEVQGDAERGYRNSVARAMEPISTVVDEAIGLVSSGEALDIDASWQFVGEITGFARDAAESAGELFLLARAEMDDSLKQPGPITRRALVAEQRKFTGMLGDEGSDHELALIEFESAVDEYYGASITTLDDTFAAARGEARKSLNPFVEEFLAILENNVMEAAGQLRIAVNQVLNKQFTALERLRKREMYKVGRQAGWRYDHSILKHVSDALDWIAEAVAVVFVAITVIAAVILIFKVAVGLLGALVGAFIAKLIVGVASAAALVYFGAEAYQKRVEEGAGPVAAFVGAIGDVTGVTQVYQALTDKSLSIEERGMLLGFGALGVFGTTLAVARIFKAVKLRFPPRVTDPRLPIAAEPLPSPPEIPIEPQQLAPVEVGGLGRTTPPRKPASLAETPEYAPVEVGGFGRQTPPRKPASPMISADDEQVFVSGFGRTPPARQPGPPQPVQPRSEFRVRGFEPPAKRLEPPVPVEAPSTVSPSIGGIGRPPGQRVPISPEAPSPPARTPQPPVSQPTPSPTPRVQGAQNARAAATAPPESPQVREPVKGKVTGATEPTPAAPETAPPAGPKGPRQSERMNEADSRLQEVREIEVTARQKADRAAKALAEAQRDLEFAQDLRKQGYGKRESADELVAEQNKRVRNAKKENKAAQKSLEKATGDVEQVAAARQRMQQLEKDIAELERQMAEAASETSTQFRPVKNIRPPTSTEAVAGRYKRLHGEKGTGQKTLAERTEDLYRSLAEHVARLTPGKPGRPVALDKARELGKRFPEIAPRDDVPIDVTTGKPIEGEWATDHLMSRTEIARDPRFKQLDPIGREEILRNVPQNYFPLTPAANSSKLNRTIANWLVALAKQGKPIDWRIAKALREADRLAREAVDKKFEELLGAMGQ